MKQNSVIKKISVILVIWLIILIADFSLATTCHRPLFCVNLTPNEGIQKFVGFGYSFHIMDNSEEFFKIDAYKGFLLGHEICGNYMD